MSPPMTAIRNQKGSRPVSSPLPFPTTDRRAALSREIVVDWQMPADNDRKN